MPQTLEKHFKTLYPWAESSDIHTSYAPYRICPLGAHIDHQYGIITGFALDKGVTLRFLLSTDGAVNLDSLELSVPRTTSTISTGIANWGLQGMISGKPVPCTLSTKSTTTSL